MTTVIKMNDKVERLAKTVTSQQQKIEDLAVRVVRLETAIEIALTTTRRAKKIERRSADHG